MVGRIDLLRKVVELLSESMEIDPIEVSEDIPLIGPDTALSSRQLVDVLLSIEEYMEDECEVEFDWTSDSALSIRNSMFRTVGTLTDHLYSLVLQGS